MEKRDGKREMGRERERKRDSGKERAEKDKWRINVEIKPHTIHADVALSWPKRV